jgi:hypothetical protein
MLEASSGPATVPWGLTQPERPPCSARTRAGHPCKRRALENGRCPNHGGLSTGPKTDVGKARIAEAQRLRWAQWRNMHGPKTSLLIIAREVHDGLGGVHRRGDRPLLPAVIADILVSRKTAILAKDPPDAP